MGAWIETLCFTENSDIPAVAPYVGAWIETALLTPITDEKGVAPYVGAWIETLSILRRVEERVAPYVGAWIETSVRYDRTAKATSRTLCGCVD